jgi:hypothetical protein
MSAYDRKGCKAGHELLFDAIEIDHFSPPILHLMLGLVNHICANLVSELQAGCEAFTDACFELEGTLVQKEEEVTNAKEERRLHELHGGGNIQCWKASTCWA